MNTFNSMSSLIKYVTNTSNILEKLSRTGKNAMLGTGKQAGALACKLLYSNYNGPVITIRRSSDSVTHDFYSDINGNLTTALGSGATITSWLSGATAYFIKWWDQTGNGNHATQNTTTLQPIYNTTTKTGSFNGTGYFSLPTSAFPSGNHPYSYIYTPTGFTTTLQQVIYYGGGNGSTIYIANTTYLNVTASQAISNSWWSEGYTDNANSALNGVKVADLYDGTNNKGKSFYFNNTLYTNMTASAATMIIEHII